jgi:hypothetical protein
VRADDVGRQSALVARVRTLPTAAEVRAMVSDYVFSLAAQRKEPQ